MGLDAFVSCNCYELGKLREPPPHPEHLFITLAGCLEFDYPRTEDWKRLPKEELAELMRLAAEFTVWEFSDRRCEHEEGILLHYRLGNAGGIGALHAELSREADKFTVLLEKVIYSGTHSGDYLPLEHVERLKPELEALEHFECTDADVAEYIGEFRQQMVELVEASLSVGKSIWF